MIDHTLHLASPIVYDPRVEAAQAVLKGGNVFGIDFLRGNVDGQFGEATGRACVRAKYFLGYPTAALEPTYGSKLDGYLLGEKLPDTAMGNRAALRDKLAKKPQTRVKALARAVKEIGVKEHPAGSNMTKYGAWYGVNGQPWCAIFVSWCYGHSGSSLRYAYVPYIVQDARAGRNGLQVVRDPAAGDLVCYDWDGGVADHVGLYEKPSTPGSFFAVEGNTSVGNDSNGGEVMRRTRSGGQVQAYVRVGR